MRQSLVRPKECGGETEHFSSHIVCIRPGHTHLHVYFCKLVSQLLVTLWLPVPPRARIESDSLYGGWGGMGCSYLLTVFFFFDIDPHRFSSKSTIGKDEHDLREDDNDGDIHTRVHLCSVMIQWVLYSYSERVAERVTEVECWTLATTTTKGW